MAADEPNWLTPEQLIDINEEVVSATGEPFFVRDRGLLGSAAERPCNYFAYNHERDVVTLAFVLLLGVAQNHPFEQGNKRTAFLGALEMLKSNGYEFEAPDTTETAATIELAIEGVLDEDEFIETMRQYVAPS